MTGPALAAPFELLWRDGGVRIRRRADAVDVASLDGSEAVVLGLLDGTRATDEVAVVLRQALGDDGHARLRRLLGRLGPLLQTGATREYGYGLEQLARSSTEGCRLRTLPGPRVLHWWVTSACPKRCVYCFADPVHSGAAADATLPRERLGEIFREARSLGAETVLVAGAEPLLRQDVPEVMGDAVAAGLVPVMTTKHKIDERLAKRLAAAGVQHISLSVDSMDPQFNAAVVGTRHYPDQVRRSVRSLQRAGVAFSFQAVVLRQYPEAFVSVAEFAAEAGARVVQVVPFESVRRPIAELSNTDMLCHNDTHTEDLVAQLDARLEGVRVELFREIGEAGRGAGLECDVGITKLFFLPDGVVHRCYKLIDDRTLDGADLRTVSVAEAWHDAAYADVIAPPRSAYAGSACGGCDRFDGCHAEGRCVYRARMDHGAYARPDRACERSTRVRLPVL